MTDSGTAQGRGARLRKCGPRDPLHAIFGGAGEAVWPVAMCQVNDAAWDKRTPNTALVPQLAQRFPRHCTSAAALHFKYINGPLSTIPNSRSALFAYPSDFVFHFCTVIILFQSLCGLLLRMPSLRPAETMHFPIEK